MQRKRGVKREPPVPGLPKLRTGSPTNLQSEILYPEKLCPHRNPILALPFVQFPAAHYQEQRAAIPGFVPPLLSPPRFFPSVNLLYEIYCLEWLCGRSWEEKQQRRQDSKLSNRMWSWAPQLSWGYPPLGAAWPLLRRLPQSFKFPELLSLRIRFPWDTVTVTSQSCVVPGSWMSESQDTLPSEQNTYSTPLEKKTTWFSLCQPGIKWLWLLG